MIDSCNEDQLRAVLSDSKKILCLAGAGTGKTFCMLSRISRLVDDGVDPSSILVLTFTNAAAFEMKSRYLSNHEGACPDFRTFHAFCYHLLSTNSGILSKLGYKNIPSIADESEQKRIQKQASMQIGVKLPKNKLTGKVELDDLDQFHIDILKKAERRLMLSKNLITFDDLCYRVCELFYEDDNLIKQYKARYKCVFVDEFQDTDPKQFKFIQTFRDSSIFVVGDALQAIYGFRGADSSIIKSLASDESWETVKLHQNYRSTKQICDFANSNSTYADSNYRIEINSDRDGHTVQIRDSWKYTDLVEMCRNSSESGRSCAVLFRTNMEVDKLQSVLDDNDIVYTTKNSKESARPIILAAINNDYLVDWLASKLNSDAYAQYIRLSSTTNYNLNDFLSDFNSYDSVRESAKLVAYVRKVCRCNITDVKKAQLLSKCIEINIADFDNKVSTMSRFLSKILESCPEECSDCKLYVGTIHSVKGLEYDKVILAGVGGKFFKLDKEDNQNLLYVGITRAKNDLTIFRG